jgi:hypothetical protein
MATSTPDARPREPLQVRPGLPGRFPHPMSGADLQDALTGSSPSLATAIMTLIRKGIEGSLRGNRSSKCIEALEYCSNFLKISSRLAGFFGQKPRYICV